MKKKSFFPNEIYFEIISKYEFNTIVDITNITLTCKLFQNILKKLLIKISVIEEYESKFDITIFKLKYNKKFFEISEETYFYFSENFHIWIKLEIQKKFFKKHKKILKKKYVIPLNIFQKDVKILLKR